MEQSIPCIFSNTISEVVVGVLGLSAVWLGHSGLVVVEGVALVRCTCTAECLCTVGPVVEIPLVLVISSLVPVLVVCFSYLA